MKMNSFILYIALAALALLCVACFSSGKSNPLESERFTGRVGYVFDGDTLRLKGITERIRLWGIDTPEKGEKGADAARKALNKLVKGKRLEIIKMDTDRYDRTVGRVILPNGNDVSAIMIREGHAIEYCLYSKGYYGTCG